MILSKQKEYKLWYILYKVTGDEGCYDMYQESLYSHDIAYRKGRNKDLYSKSLLVDYPLSWKLDLIGENR